MWSTDPATGRLLFSFFILYARRPVGRLGKLSRRVLPVALNPSLQPPRHLAEYERCLFETYFTLDAEEPANRIILQNLVAVAREAAPGQGLEPLGGALVRKATETGSSEAAFFLSLVPPTVRNKSFCM